MPYHQLNLEKLKEIERKELPLINNMITGTWLLSSIEVNNQREQVEVSTLDDSFPKYLGSNSYIITLYCKENGIEVKVTLQDFLVSWKVRVPKTRSG